MKENKIEKSEKVLLNAEQYMRMKGLQIFSFAIEKMYPNAIHSIEEWDEIVGKENFN